MPSMKSSLGSILRGGVALGLVLSMIGAGAAQAGPVFGDTVHVTSDSPTNYDTAVISFAGLPGGSGSLDVYAAPEWLSGTYGAAITAFSNFLVYCTDLYNYSGSAIYTVGYLTSSHQPAGSNDLSTTQVNNIASLIAANHSDQTATQLAIWSVEYGTAFSYSTTTAITDDVTSYLHGLDGSAPAHVTLYQLQAAGVQGFAYTEVPEPMSMALLGIAMTGIGAVRRRQAPLSRASA